VLERWRDIPGWEGLYQASDQGRIRSVDRSMPHSGYGTINLKGRVLSPAPVGKSGHLKTNLWKDNIRHGLYVHRLVSLIWIGPCPDGQEVCHGPNGVSDNSVGNLSYGTHQQNSLDMYRDGTHCGKAVRRSDGVEFVSMSIAAKVSSCNRRHIGAVCAGHRNSTGGYGWEYIEEDFTGPDCPGCRSPGNCDDCEYQTS
jgi:hypothetical protein